MINQLVTSRIVFGISILLYLIALTQPCFDTDKAEGEIGEGLALLISGFFGFFSSLAGLTWLANPALFVSWLQYKKSDKSLIFSLLASVIAVCFLQCKEIIVNEGGGTGFIENYRIGYWLWFASILAMLLSNLLQFLSAKPKAIALK